MSRCSYGESLGTNLQCLVVSAVLSVSSGSAVFVATAACWQAMCARKAQHSMAPQSSSPRVAVAWIT